MSRYHLRELKFFPKQKAPFRERVGVIVSNGRRLAALVGLVVVVLSAYGYGIRTGDKHLWPYPLLKILKELFSHGPVQFDSYERLAVFPGKEDIACPAQTDKTAVLFVFGQSNSSNNGGQRYRGIDDRVVNFFDGHCYRAQSPLLGGENTFEETWTPLANKLVEAGRFDRVIIVPAGVGGSSVSDWAEGGHLHPMLQSVLDNAAQTYRITHVLWHQGERDFADRTAKRVYIVKFRSVLSTLRAHGVTAPVFMCKVSFDNFDGPPWTPDNPIRQAQIALIDGKDVHAGPDTDLLLNPTDRYDGTHFAASGMEKVVASWLEVLN
jgi:hypothetical protein